MQDLQQSVTSNLHEAGLGGKSHCSKSWKHLIRTALHDKDKKRKQDMIKGNVGMEIAK
jgi:hypothetical protein